MWDGWGPRFRFAPPGVIDYVASTRLFLPCVVAELKLGAKDKVPLSENYNAKSLRIVISCGGFL